MRRSFRIIRTGPMTSHRRKKEEARELESQKEMQRYKQSQVKCPGTQAVCRG